MDAKLVAQGRVPGGPSLTAALQETLIGVDFDHLDVAVAYATVSGIIALEKALTAFPGTSRWVVGLDDAISQPEAIVRLMGMPGATVRLATLAAQGRRFHPKVYCLWSSEASDQCVLSVGSGNMTLNGLRKNGEVAAILSATSAKESDELKSIWAEMWELGKPATQNDLDDYRGRYKLARKARKAVTAAGASPPDPEPDEPVNDDVALNGEPSTATFAWLDAGSATAQGREVELPRAMVPYFGVVPQTASPVQLRLQQANGRVDLLPLTMRVDNSMWRIGFTSASISAGTGRNTLRPAAGGNRSDLAVAFTKTGKRRFDLEFVPLGSARYQSLVAKATAAGGYYRTRKTPGGRSFGFF